MHRMLLYNVDMNIYKSSSVFQIDFFFLFQVIPVFEIKLKLKEVF